MSLIFGVYNTNGSPINSIEFRRVLEDLSYWNPDYAECRVVGSVGLGHLGLRVTEDSLFERQPLYHSQSNCSITADVRLDNRTDLAHELGIVKRELCRISDSDLILLAYEKWENKCVEHLLGDFAFAVWDGNKQQLFLGRDHVGIKPLFYSFRNGILVFGSELRAVLGFSSVSRERNEKWIANVLSSIYLSDTRESTFYSSVSLLAAANCVQVSKRGIEKTRYWKLDEVAEVRFRSFEEFSEGFREHFDEAVRCRLRSASPIASEISAGIDSTSILCSVIRMRGSGDGISTFTHGVPQEASGVLRDECELTDRFADSVGLAIPHRVQGARNGIFSLFRDACIERNAPLMDVWALFSQPLYDEVKKSSSRVLLSGAGGNNLVSHPASLAYYDFAERYQFGRLWTEHGLECKRWGIGMPRRLKQFGKSLACGLLPGAFEIGECFGRRALHPHFLNTKFRENFEIEKRLRCFRERAHIRDLRSKQIFQTTKLYLDRARLPESSISARSRHIELRYPMLDIRLMEYCLSAPSHYKRRNGFGRYLLRGCLSDLPDFIRWQENNEVGAIPWGAGAIPQAAPSILNMLSDLRANAKVTELLDISSLNSYVNNVEKSHANGMSIGPQLPAQLALMLAYYYSEYA